MPQSLPDVRLFLATLALGFGGLVDVVFGQAGSSEADSLRHYELSEIVVGSATAGRRVADMGSVRRVSLASIVRADAPDVAGLARLIPSAHLQTNSRGESLIYLRGSGERQVAVFLDGALLNIPWDNRVDLSAIPASILGGLQVTQGASSVLYGTNVLGGVVNLATRSLEGEGSISEVTFAGGSGEFRRADGMHVRRWGKHSLVAAAGFNRTDGLPLANDAELSFGQSDGTTRTNTDKRLAHGFLRLSRSGERFQTGFSVLHVDAAKGVAPEGHLDPALEDVRYWRYPDWGVTMLSGNFATSTASGLILRGAAWGSGFRQRIDQFGDVDYDVVLERQDDRDESLGVRVVGEKPLKGGLLRGAANGLVSRHRQVDSERSSCGVVDCSQAGSPLIGQPQLTYRQSTLSVGAEYAGPLGDRSRFVVGGNLDRFSTPETGDKPASDAFRAWGASGTFERDVAVGWSVHISTGRKVRFPTMRELFGTALNRFMINEDLKPETAWLFDAGIEGDWSRGRVEVTAFLNRTWDTIDQENVMSEGGRLRHRINLPGSRVVGLEAIGDVRVSGPVRLDYAITVSEPSALDDDTRDVLVEKPDVLGSLGGTVAFRSAGSFTAEAVYTGRAFGLDPENELVPLPKVLQLNARLSLRHYTTAGVFGELFARVDNLTDKAVFPQLGLPSAGRRVQLGLSVAF